MKVLHPIENKWVEVEGHTVKQIADELNLPDTSEGSKWALKVDGSLIHSGTVNGEVVEVVEHSSDTVENNTTVPVEEDVIKDT